MNRLIDLQKEASELSGRIELIEQLRAHLLCNRIDERSLRLSLEGLLREAHGRDGMIEASPPRSERPEPGVPRLSPIGHAQQRMDALRLRSQLRLGAIQERICALDTTGRIAANRIFAGAGSR